MADKQELVPAAGAEVAVFTPPASFEVVDRGAAESFQFKEHLVDDADLEDEFAE